MARHGTAQHNSRHAVKRTTIAAAHTSMHTSVYDCCSTKHVYAACQCACACLCTCLCRLLNAPLPRLSRLQATPQVENTAVHPEHAYRHVYGHVCRNAYRHVRKRPLKNSTVCARPRTCMSVRESMRARVCTCTHIRNLWAQGLLVLNKHMHFGVCGQRWWHLLGCKDTSIGVDEQP